MLIYVANRRPPSPPVEPLATGPGAWLPPRRVTLVARPKPLPFASAPDRVRTVQALCCAAMDIPDWYLTTAQRTRPIAHPRQISMIMVMRWCFLSWAKSGHAHGGRDHTTVMHAMWAIRERIDAGDSATVERFDRCDAAIRAALPASVQPLENWWEALASDA